MATNVFEPEVLTMLRSSFRNLIEAIDLDMILDMEECSLDYRLWPENQLLDSCRYDMDSESKRALDTVVKELLSSRRVVQTLLSYALDPPPPKCSPQDNRVKKYPKLSVQILVSLTCVLKVLAQDEDLLAGFFARLLGKGATESVSEGASSSSAVGNGTTGSDDDEYNSSESSDVSPKKEWTKQDATILSETKQAMLTHSPHASSWFFDEERSNHFNKILEALLEYQKGVHVVTFVRKYAFSRIVEDVDEQYPTLLHALVRGIHLHSVTELLLKMLSNGIPLRLFCYSYAGMEAYEDEREASNLDEDSIWSRAYLRFPFEEEEQQQQTQREENDTWSVDSDVVVTEENEEDDDQQHPNHPSKREQTLEWLFQSDHCIRLVRILLHRLYSALLQDWPKELEETSSHYSSTMEPGNAVEVVRSVSRVLSRLAIVSLRLTDEMESSQQLSAQPMPLSPTTFMEGRQSASARDKTQPPHKLEPEAHVIIDHMLHMLYKAYDRLFMDGNISDSELQKDAIARHSHFLAGVHFLFGAATKVLAAFLDIRVELNNWGELPSLVAVLLKYVDFGVTLLHVTPKQHLMYFGALDENRHSIQEVGTAASSSLLGLHRLQLVKFFTALVGVPHIDVQTALVQNEVLAPIIQLVFDYPNHNVLHSQIERLVVAIIRGNTDYELRQHLLDVLVPRIYQVAVDRMQGKVAPWVSYMGHVKRLAEELIAASAIQPSLCQMLKKNSWWSSFMMVNRKMSGMEDPLHHEEGKEEDEKDRMRKEKDQA
ncbi:hypothetical protein GAYE_PCTG30G0713 [Galdieria yellowstonensis]|uniref:Uncharacterized protein n=1 Tax=Galdieria yellowstonensis TaxID=3028027 RepID=A0AAV9I5W3_9RHOD|nr:hypothetical protein GAYE_PCTG30G0713 [Galdieria yellowstonensis]